MKAMTPSELEAQLRDIGARRYHRLHPFHVLLHGGKCTKGQGVLIEDGCMKPCECATPEWLDKLAESEARHAAAKAARAPVEGEAVA